MTFFLDELDEDCAEEVLKNRQNQKLVLILGLGFTIYVPQIIPCLY